MSDFRSFWFVSDFFRFSDPVIQIFENFEKKIINFHFSLGFAIFVHFCSEKSMLKLNVSFFKPEKLYHVMCTHQAHRVHQAHIRHIFSEISMTSRNGSLEGNLEATSREIPPGMSTKSPVQKLIASEKRFKREIAR